MNRLLYTALMSIATLTATAQDKIQLWPNGAPNAKVDKTYNEETVMISPNVPRIYYVTDPTLTIFRPTDSSTGQHPAIVICPGGGYQRLAFDKEGLDIAQKFAENGFVAFVLKYRLPSDRIMGDKSVGPLQDVQRAIRLVRLNAEHYGVDANRIGVIGFSAGGHLASTACTLYDYEAYSDADSAVSARPDFGVLMYPVISMEYGLTHHGSHENLIGGLGDENLLTTLFSTEKQVKTGNPPVFMVHAIDDNSVPFHNSTRFAEAMIENGNDVELHLFPHGGHGFGLGEDRHVNGWFDMMLKWFKEAL